LFDIYDFTFGRNVSLKQVSCELSEGLVDVDSSTLAGETRVA
jgi:hypothetical protein